MHPYECLRVASATISEIYSAMDVLVEYTVHTMLGQCILLNSKNGMQQHQQKNINHFAFVSQTLVTIVNGEWGKKCDIIIGCRQSSRSLFVATFSARQTAKQNRKNHYNVKRKNAKKSKQLVSCRLIFLSAYRIFYCKMHEI